MSLLAGEPRFQFAVSIYENSLCDRAAVTGCDRTGLGCARSAVAALIRRAELLQCLCQANGF